MKMEDVWPFLRQGKRVARHGWSGQGQWLRIVYPLDFVPGSGDISWTPEEARSRYISYGQMTLPYVAVWTCKGHWVPWCGSQKDFLDDDWFVLDPVCDCDLQPCALHQGTAVS